MPISRNHTLFVTSWQPLAAEGPVTEARNHTLFVISLQLRASATASRNHTLLLPILELATTPCL